MTALPTPPPDRDAAVAWVGEHLSGLFSGPPAASPVFRGGQSAADQALEGFDVAGYAAARNEVWPGDRRGASRLSPYIRHGLLTLPRVWGHADAGPSSDSARFRDELLWQEYARHLYARLGSAMATSLRSEVAPVPSPWAEPWPGEMACMTLTVGELERDGWLVNQTRMWLASQWTLRAGAAWRDGEDRFFTHLLDGSRAANRMGWQWTVGTLTGRPYAFTRHQVERRAPGVCDGCPLRDRCPIERAPATGPMPVASPDPRLRSDPDLERTAGPAHPLITSDPGVVWITAESLGDDDPALAAHPDVSVVFVFDEVLLARLQLSAKRLVFLAECLADLAGRRRLEVHRGDPVAVLAGREVAATFTPVPGWRRRSGRLDVTALHPWPWLRRPHGGPSGSFSAWRKRLSG